MSGSAAGRSSRGEGAKELAYAAERLTSIEVNGTFYRTQTPSTFRKWASEVADGFRFSLKGPRYATNRRVLKEAGDSIKRFLDSGVTELGDRLGPLLWQFAPTKKFDATDFGGFLELLPARHDGHLLRHVIEVRHDSFRSPEFIALLRKFDMPVVYTDHNRLAKCQVNLCRRRKGFALFAFPGPKKIGNRSVTGKQISYMRLPSYYKAVRAF